MNFPSGDIAMNFPSGDDVVANVVAPSAAAST
jgi:hypothetical protein